MAIKIIDEAPGQDVYLTAAEYTRLQEEYKQYCLFYSGVTPTFESWVRSKNVGNKLLNEEAGITNV